MDIVKFAVPNLADKNPEASEYYGRTTPLHEAAENGHTEIVEFLVPLLGNETNPENSIGLTPLHLAAENGHINVVKLYAEVLENPNPGRTKSNEFTGVTPMHYAASNGHLGIVEILASILRQESPR